MPTSPRPLPGPRRRGVLTLKSNIISTAKATDGNDLDQVVADAIIAVENATGTLTASVDPPLESIDGEPVQAIQTTEYEVDGEPARTLMLLTVHGDVSYSFTLNAAADSFEAGRSSLTELAESVTWQ